MSTPQYPPPPDGAGGGPPSGGGWQPPGEGYGAPPPGPPKSNGVAIASLVCGIIALLLSWIPGVNFLSLALGIAALITGAIGLRNAAQRGGRGLAIAGLVTGGLAIVVSILVLVFAVSLFQDVVNDPEFQDMIESEMQRQQELQSELEGAGG